MTEEPIAQKSPPLSALTARQVQWILGGAAMTFATMPGQTVFIAQFNSAIRVEYGLSHGEFGGLYTMATLASAMCLIWAGVLADRMGPRRLALFSLFGLAIIALLMGVQDNIALLVVAMAGLRFFGQGMLSHVSMTTMSRWFNRFRGRALSFAGLGFTAGEAVLPFTVTLAIAAVGWRSVWFATAAALVCVVAPLIWLLFRDPPDGAKALAAGRVNPDAALATSPTGSQWTRRVVLRDPLFWSVIPGIMGPPAIGTLFIFHQAHLAELKGWELTTFTAFFPVLSISVVLTAITAGFLVDRFGAWRVLPLVFMPLCVACLVIGTLSPVWSIFLLFMLFGMTNGLMTPVVGALWAEVYGTAHIGAIRSLATSALVAASALGPGLAGYLIDAGVELTTQSFAYAGYCLGCALLMFSLRHSFGRRVALNSVIETN